MPVLVPESIKAGFFLLFLSFLTGSLCYADTETDDLDELFSGFESDEFESVEQQEPSDLPVASKNWRFSGDIELTSHYNFAQSKPTLGTTDFRGWSQLRIKFRPELWFNFSENWDAKISASGDYDFIYQLEGRENYSRQVLNDDESETEFRETFLRGRLTSNLDIKLGRQIVVWGKSDNLRVVDVLNPLDLREPGLVDIEDLRLPLTMSRLDYYLGDWSLTAIAIHELRFDKRPVFGSDFYPSPVLLPAQKKLHDGGSNTEFALALSGVLQGWDISFHLARLFNDATHLESVGLGLQQHHSRLDMAGIASNVAMGNWLWKAEIAYLDGLEFLVTPDQDFARTDIMAGVEYSGFDDTTLSLETVVRHINDYDSILKSDPIGTDKNTVQTAFRYSADFLHSRLNVVVLAMRFGEDLNSGGFTRLRLKYELSEGLNMTAGVVGYHGGETIPFNRVSNNDRVFISLKYSF